MRQRIVGRLKNHLLGQSAGFGDVAKREDHAGNPPPEIAQGGRQGADGVSLADSVDQNAGFGQLNWLALFQARGDQIHAGVAVIFVGDLEHHA